MLKKLLFFAVSISLLCTISFGFKTVFADDSDADNIQEKIDEFEDILDDLAGQEKSLKNEIIYFDSQISLTQLRIQNAIVEIEKRTKLLGELVEDIANLEVRIEGLSVSIDYQKNVLGQRMRARYKSSTVSPVVILFGSDSLDEVVNKAQYLKTMQFKDQELLDEMEKTKAAYTQQKTLFETKKAQTEELKAQVEAERANLEVYKSNLDQQRTAKQTLLEKTKNDEAKFQELLEDAKKELAQIINAASVLQGTEPKKVDAGEYIGIQGNTGYSFGDHLHFGVYRYGSIDDIVGWDWYNSNTVNPKKKLKSKKVYWNTGCEGASYKNIGSGKWKWPLESPIVSQGYGNTCYSSTYYDGKDHPAYDMYGPGGTPVRAVAAGKAYFCRNCLGDGGNGVFIFHDDDYMTVYWHLQ